MASSLAAALAARLAALSPPHHDAADARSPASSQGPSPAPRVATCTRPHAPPPAADTPSLSPLRSAMKKPFDTRSCLSDGSVSSSSSVDAVRPHGLRPNEHLAVLLPKHLWKPDSDATVCDRFPCQRRFSVVARKHHCRKCGGIFCSDCSARATPLLDTTHLDFLNPPRNVAITAFESPIAPVLTKRVCDDCWDQIHGTTRAGPAARRTPPLNVQFQWENDSASSSASNSPRSPPTPLDGSAIITPHLPTRTPLRRTYGSPRAAASPLRASSGTATPIAIPPTNATSPSAAGAADGELETYPLRHASAICKATGGGRWVPKPAPQIVGYRVPGTKAEYELELEAEEAARRMRKLNPVVRDGDIQVRAPKELEPHSLAGRYEFSTF